VSRYRTILLGEDDPRDAEMTIRALQANHLVNDVVVVTDGVQVLEYLRRQGQWERRSGGLPGVLLLDIKMPRMNGLDVLREIRDDPVLKILPVVMLTSSRETPDLQAAYALGANAYVVKPVGFDEFVAAVKQIGNFWAVVNEPPAGDDGENAVGGMTLFETR
jgi:two-component system, response regulator